MNSGGILGRAAAASYVKHDMVFRQPALSNEDTCRAGAHTIGLVLSLDAHTYTGPQTRRLTRPRPTDN